MPTKLQFLYPLPIYPGGLGTLDFQRKHSALEQGSITGGVTLEQDRRDMFFLGIEQAQGSCSVALSSQYCFASTSKLALLEAENTRKLSSGAEEKENLPVNQDDC